LVEGGFQGVLVLGLGAPPAGQQLGSLFHGDSLPLGDLHGMHPICRRQLMDRAFPTERREDHLRLTFPTRLPP
jgi:hypothetical protein